MTLTANDCLKWFGEPEKAAQKWCIVWNKPKTCIIPPIPNRIYMHKLVIPYWDVVYRELCDQGLEDLIKTYDGCFQVRNQKGSSKLSLHSWAIPVDLNQAGNQLGKKPTMDSRIVEIFERNGYEWGGRWTRPDGMHFQIKREIMEKELKLIK